MIDETPSLKLHTITGSAQLLGISRTTLHRLLDAGEIGYVRIAGDRRIPHSELTAWTERNTVKAGLRHISEPVQEFREKLGHRERGEA